MLPNAETRQNDATTMFVRFRSSRERLQISLVEARRLNGSVRQEHVASLGSIAMPPSITGRVRFWNRLHERLAKLSNRLGAEEQAKVLAATQKSRCRRLTNSAPPSSRTPRPTPDSGRRLRICSPAASRIKKGCVLSSTAP